MKSAIIIAIVIAGIIGSIAIFASISPDTWQDNRTDFTGVAPPDENKEKIDCLSNGGTWEFASCTIVRDTAPQIMPTPDCSGTASCITESVTQIIDGDTIYTENYKIRLSLTNTPEKNEPRFQEAKSFTAMHCPIGSVITVDQDDLQPFDIYDRMLGKVYCEGGVINEILLSNGLGSISTQYCDNSEFASESWAQKYGCKPVENPTMNTKVIPKEIPKTTETSKNCDPSYPDVCIPPYPPDLNCKDIPYKRFTVLQPDPHGFDRNKDGIGCES